MKVADKWAILNSRYVNKGLRIIPIRANSKLPAIDKWNVECSSNAYQILYWLETNHDMNFALPCKENNLFVLDLDTHDESKNGIDNFKKLCDSLNIDLPKTLTQETKSGGLHYIFVSDEDLVNVPGAANAFNDFPGIDIRNSNYILVEPSEIDGKSYRFTNDLEPQEMPTELKKYIIDNVGLKNSKKRTSYKKPKDIIQEGSRDEELFSYINNLYFHTNLDYDEILLLANNFNETMFDDPLEERDVKYKVKKAFEKDRGNRVVVNVGESNEKEI